MVALTPLSTGRTHAMRVHKQVYEQVSRTIGEIR